MPIDDIGQVTPIPDYDPNEDVNSGSTGTASGTTSNIAGYDVTNEPLAPNLILNRNQTSVGIYTPILTPVSNGYQLSWTNNAGLPNPNAVIISNGTNGTDGEDGTDGSDGVTYTPHVAEITNGFQITFTNDGGRPNPSPVEIHNGAEGPQGPQGIQGETGPAGADGADGEDGFSPVATVTKSGTIITITITDANGTTTQSFDTATGGVPIDYMMYDDDEDEYIQIPVTGVKAYTAGGEVNYKHYSKLTLEYEEEGTPTTVEIEVGKPIPFTWFNNNIGNVSGIDISGNVLTISSDAGYSPISVNLVPGYGTTGYVLTKTANGYEWQAPQGGLPSGGSYGQILTKDINGNPMWVDPGNYVPIGGTAGQVLTKYGSQDNEYYWEDVNQVPPGGSQGQVLTKGVNGYAWDNIPSPSAGASLLISTPLYLDSSASSSSRIYEEGSLDISLSEGDLLLVDVDAVGALSTAGMIRIEANMFEGAIMYNLGSHSVYYPITSFECHLTFVFSVYTDTTIDKLQISLSTNDGAFTSYPNPASIKIVKL